MKLSNLNPSIFFDVDKNISNDVFNNILDEHNTITPTANIAVTSREHQAIILHDGPGNLDHISCKHFFSPLSTYMELYYLDQRGHGRSEDGEIHDFKLEHCAQDIEKVCVMLGLQNPILIGVGWGGYVALSYALSKRTIKPRAIILCNTVAQIDLSVCKVNFQKYFGLDTAELFETFVLSPNEGNYENLIESCKHNSLENHLIPEARKNLSFLFHFIQQEYLKFNFLPNLEDLSCRTLVFSGTNDPFHPKILVEKLINALKPEIVQSHFVHDSVNPIYEKKHTNKIEIIQSFIKTLPAIENEQVSA